DALPIFLRGFSAPVRVEFAQGSQALGFLARHDSDGFVRWDALQTLLVRQVTKLQSGASINTELQDLFRDLVVDAIGCAEDAEAKLMLARILTLPDEGYLFTQLASVDVDEVCDARALLLSGLAGHLLPRWWDLYHANASVGAYRPDSMGMARRALRNVALRYLAAALTGEELQRLLEAHYVDADNLTDRRAALVEIVNARDLDEAFRESIVAEFYEVWQAEALVVDVWFSVQASSERADAASIRKLESHQAFDQKNPNKLRSVYGAFGQFNHRNFHATDGSGYDLLSERIIMLDKSNPQVAARFLTPLTRWRRYDPRRQGLMRAALERIGAEDELSKDVFEIVGKSLAVVDR
ncbi:MAG: aminopeptidase N C-terminal domain-containing protein, partial [Pseudomonadales bacterium]